MNKKHLYLFLLSILLLAAAVIPARAEEQAADLSEEISTTQVIVPYFPGEVIYEEMSVFWFGQVGDQNSYADVRIGYNDDYLRINIAVFDRWLWYDPDPGTDLDNHDAIAIMLDPNHNGGSAPRTNDLKILTQFTWWEEDRTDWEFTFLGDGVQWAEADVAITTTSGWRGNAPNDNTGNDRGWVMNINIPYSALGLSGKPANGETWGMGAVLYDRDNAEPAAMATSYAWPSGALVNQPSTWGDIIFNPPSLAYSGTITGETTIREGLDGASVPDGHVGGNTMCGDGLDFWTEWGNTNYAGEEFMNIQNQSDVADFPCFSKYFVQFPLDSIPEGKKIISASLVMHQFGNSDPSQAEPSLISAYHVSNNWTESSLTWNNAPKLYKTLDFTWVDPLTDFPGWPGVTHEWDVTKGVVEAYASGTDVSFGLYSADGAYHSGKYFVSSDTPEWNEAARPTLVIEWADSAPAKVPLFTPKDNIPNVRPTFTWGGDELADEYRLYVSRAALGVMHNQWHATNDVCSGADCSFRIDEHLLTGNHTWWVQTRNAYGGEWSDPAYFKLINTTPPDSAPVQIAPVDTSGASPDLSWTAVERASWYKVYMSNNTDGKVYNAYHKAIEICYADECTLPADIHALALNAEKHFWWVMAVNTGGNGPWSAQASFTVTP